MVDQRILDAFQMMWGPFPGPVLLVHKNRTVLAVNDRARDSGVSVGIKCFSLNPEIGSNDNHCKHCKATLAVETGDAIRSQGLTGGQDSISYWIPLKETPDVYVHFAISTAKAMAAGAIPPQFNGRELS
jgi:hypothetical protein